MKRYIRSSKQFYSTDGNLVDVDRETRILTYKYSYDGDYFGGRYYTYIEFYDVDGTKYIIQRIMDLDNLDNPYNLEKGESYSVSGYFVPVESIIIGGSNYYIIKQPRIRK